MRKVTNQTGLLICIPTLGRPISIEWAWAFKSLVPPINFNTNFMQIYGKPVDVARNEALSAALEQGAKYLFFIGDDTVPPAHSLKQLIFRMEHDPLLGVVGGVYFSKSDPPSPLVFKEFGSGSYWDWKVGEYFPVAGLGMDCTLIRTAIASEMSKPWFKTVDSDLFLDGKNQADQWTEDLYFCKKVIEETKYSVYIDAGIQCTHVDVYSGRRFGIPAGSLPTRRLEVKKEKRAVDLGCGPTDRSEEFKDYDLVRVDVDERWNPDYRCDVRTLPFADEEFDLVFSSHVLEHFPRGDYEFVLREWLRILKKGGIIRFILPNIQWAAEQIVKGVVDNDVLNVLYGAQTSQWDFHYNGFTPTRLKELLATNGVSVVNESLSGYNIILEGTKAEGDTKS